ncbi:MAG: SulP family inorganic anion transporter [Candidatus Nanopelagicales bacterium]
MADRAAGLLPRLGLGGGLLPYRREWLSPDLVAGATLAAVAIPEGLGYARIAGMPPETGLYTCLLPVLVFVVFASTRRLVIGADSATAAISAGAVGLLAVGDPDQFFALSCLLAIMSGFLLIAAGRLRLGFLSDFMSRSVLAGFLTGVGIQIAVGQLDGMLGVSGSGDTTWQELVQTIVHIPDANIWDVVLSTVVITLILGLGRVSARIPGPLIAVVGSIALAGLLEWEERRGVEMVGALPGGLPSIDMPSASLADLLALVPTALIILLVQVAQSVSTASAFAIDHDDEHDPNRDLVGLGAANLAAGLGSSFVVNGSPTKTAISDRSGTRSQLAMGVLALITIPVLLFLTQVFEYLPEATLAAVVFVIAVHLTKFDTLRMLHGLPQRGEFWVAVTTAVFVALVGVGGGILYAIVASIVVHLAHTSHPHNTVLTVDERVGRVEHPVAEGAQTRPGLIVYRFAANLYYANSSRLVADVRVLMRGAPDPVRMFVLDGSEIQRVDWTSAEALRKVIQIVAASGARFEIARIPQEARDLLDFYGITDLIGEDGYVDTVRHALKRFPAQP